MAIKIEKLVFEALGEHDVRGFTCGNRSIDDFLSHAAYLDQALGLSQTTLILYEGQIVGFYSARCTKIEIDLSEASSLGIDRLFVPAIEVPYLAVHKDFQRNRIGEELIDHLVIFITDYIAPKVGCKFLFLEALDDPSLIEWYSKFGFVETTGESRDFKTPMRMPIAQRTEFPEY